MYIKSVFLLTYFETFFQMLIFIVIISIALRQSLYPLFINHRKKFSTTGPLEIEESLHYSQMFLYC